MPIYVYECSSCTQTFEAEQRITADPLTTCLCGSEGTIKRVIQPVAVAFNGSGFYVNDTACCKGPDAGGCACAGEVK